MKAEKGVFVRILFADGRPQVRRALRFFLEQQPEFEIAGEVESGSALLRAVQEHAPDVVLLDWELPGLDPRQLSAFRGTAPIIWIALSSRPESEAAALAAGADAFISKSEPTERFLEMVFGAIRRGQ